MTFAIKNIIFLICSCVIIVTAFNRQRRDVGTCGIQRISIGLIRGGNATRRGEFPWYVALMNKKIRPPEYFCSATLISHTYVVTGKN